jgi:hypothetical protein
MTSTTLDLKEKIKKHGVTENINLTFLQIIRGKSNLVHE